MTRGASPEFSAERVLILYTNPNWITEEIRRWSPREVRVFSQAKMADLDNLSRERCSVVIMSATKAVVDQTQPLEALKHWPTEASPVTIMSDLPTETEAHQAISKGAIGYDPTPNNLTPLAILIRKSLTLAGRERSRA